MRKWLDDRGFGFIRQDGGGPDVFLHRSQLLGAGIDPYSLNEGTSLSFDIGVDRNNRPTAVNVQLSP
jgi:cold shock CspA family protein